MSAHIDLRPPPPEFGKVIPFPANARTHAVTSPRLAVVVAYAGSSGEAETTIDDTSDDSLVDALRHQIVSLAEHYARDITALNQGNEALGKANADLKADLLDAWRQVARMHVRAASAECDAAHSEEATQEAVAEANALFRQVREMSIMVGELRTELAATRQRETLFREAAQCRFFEASRKRRLLEAATAAPPPPRHTGPPLPEA